MLLYFKRAYLLICCLNSVVEHEGRQDLQAAAVRFRSSESQSRKSAVIFLLPLSQLSSLFPAVPYKSKKMTNRYWHIGLKAYALMPKMWFRSLVCTNIFMKQLFNSFLLNMHTKPVHCGSFLIACCSRTIQPNHLHRFIDDGRLPRATVTTWLPPRGVNLGARRGFIELQLFRKWFSAPQLNLMIQLHWSTSQKTWLMWLEEQQWNIEKLAYSL